MHPSARRPRLTPAMADVRRGVREALAALPGQPAIVPDVRQGDPVAETGLRADAVPDARQGDPVAETGLLVESVPDARHGDPVDEIGARAEAVPDARQGDPVDETGLRAEAAPDARQGQLAAVDHPRSDAAPDARQGSTRTQPPRRLGPDAALVLVALSGGPDSLALAAATAFEAPRAGVRAGAVIVDHSLQPGSAEVAATAAEQARALGLDPVIVSRVSVDEASPDGPEAAARTARYAALDAAREATGATHVLLGHTLDDQAETVLLGLARGSGPSSLSGMSAVNGVYVRPLLGIRRPVVHQSLVDAGLEAWHDPQNLDPAYRRVRVRQAVLPMLESELGPGITEALARTAVQLREDDEALDALAAEWAAEIVEHAEAGIAVDVQGLAANPPALAQRIVRFVVAAEFGVSLSRGQTLSALRLATHWHGQCGVDLPGIQVTRAAGRLVFARR